jgi:hypothetical protein
LSASNSSGHNNRDRLELLAAAQGNSFCLQVNAFNLNSGPQIEVGLIHTLGEFLQKLFSVPCANPWVIPDRTVNGMKLAAHLFILFQHERVEAKFIAPEPS